MLMFDNGNIRDPDNGKKLVFSKFLQRSSDGKKIVGMVLKKYFAINFHCVWHGKNDKILQTYMERDQIKKLWHGNNETQFFFNSFDQW